MSENVDGKDKISPSPTEKNKLWLESKFTPSKLRYFHSQEINLEILENFTK